MNDEVNTPRKESQPQEGNRPRTDNRRNRRGLSLDELFSKEIPERVGYANELLKSKIRGTVLVKVKGRDSFLFDGTKPEPSIVKSSVQTADSLIEIGESDLLNIAQGNLNPQIAMLSDKVSVAGNAELAIYFFNLLSPN